MSTIIAGLFETIEHAADADESLRRHGFAAADLCQFANNPPGQHDQFPIGGDENADPGAQRAHIGAAAGAGVGAGAGAAVGAVVGGPPGAAVGAGVGAYVGSLIGTLGKLDGEGTEHRPVRRPAGVLVAARAGSVAQEHTAIHVLHMEGATHIEKAEGQWSGGKWTDFDPVSTPRLVEDLPAGPPAAEATSPIPAFEIRRNMATGKWEVQGPDQAQSHPQFDLRQDAVSYAIDLAEKEHAAIEVYGKDGGLIWREIYDGSTQRMRRSAGA